MTKTCGKCGHAALDDQALFCNRCGAVVPEEKKPSYPVCPGCGTVVSDELAQFCNRCGTRIPLVPAVCSTCGNPAIDDQSRFCTRCGTTFAQKPAGRQTTCPSCGTPDTTGQAIFCNRCGASFGRQPVPQAIVPNPAAPVLVTPRKPAGPLPVVTVPDSDWEPWNDTPAVPEISPAPVPVQPAQPAYQDQQADVQQKRYAHLPLVAEEMKKTTDPAGYQRAPEIPNLPERRKGGSQKKGVLGFMKK